MRTATWVVLALSVVAFGAATETAWAAEPKGDEGPSSVTLSWEKFKAITGWDDGGKPGEGGAFTLTWKEVEDLIEVRPGPDATTQFTDVVSLEWARRWPCEEVWKARRRGSGTQA